jgi:hypothetical protein
VRISTLHVAGLLFGPAVYLTPQCTPCHATACTVPEHSTLYCTISV